MSGITKGEAKRVFRGYLFLAPFLLFFVVFIVVPVLQSVVLSFTNYNMLQDAEFVGLQNYQLLFMEDDVFLIALKNTLVFGLIVGPLGYFLSFFFAWLINSLRFKRFFVLAFYAPSITSSVAMSVIWLYFFSADKHGLINSTLLGMGIITEPVLWNLNPATIMLVIIIISVWMSMGNGFLVFIAGLQNIPEEFYEVGKMEGIDGSLKELVYITLPSMKPQLLFGAINAIVGSLGVYDIAVSVAGLPSPQYAGHTVVAHLYDYAFIRFQMGYASVIAVVLFFMTYALGRICMNVFKSD